MAPDTLRAITADPVARSGPPLGRSLGAWRADDLGLRSTDGGMLPVLVAAMAFLAALALAGVLGAASLAARWQDGAGAPLTVQVPDAAAPVPRASDGAEETRLDRVMAALQASPGVGSVRVLSDSELQALLRPWLGSAAEGLGLALPAVIAVHVEAANADVAALRARLDAAAPGTLTEGHEQWMQRLSVLALSLQACAWLVLLVVGLVASLVVITATQAGLAARREAIAIVHGLGATDAYIAARFAVRAMRLAALGGLAGAVLCLPVLLVLSRLATPFTLEQAGPALSVHALPWPLWLAMPGLPVVAGLLGFVTAQVTVRRWLRRLP